MLSVVEQRASLWGALSAGTLSAAAQGVVTSDDQPGAVFAASADGSLSGDQQPLVDSTSHDLPSVSISLC